MSVANPETLDEWMEYISILQEDEILSKAKAANSKRFFDKLLEEGFTMNDLDVIMKALARKFLDFNLQPPGGLVDLSDLLTAADVTSMKLPDPKTVDYEPEPDEVDREVDALDLETDWEETTPLLPTEVV